MKDIGIRIVVRWVANSFGLWLSGRLISGIDLQDDLKVIIVAGLVLSLVNALLKPLLVIMALPAIVFSLGLFLIIVNGLMVLLASELVSSFEVEGFGSAVLAGIIIGLVNYAVTTTMEGKLQDSRE